MIALLTLQQIHFTAIIRVYEMLLQLGPDSAKEKSPQSWSQTYHQDQCIPDQCVVHLRGIALLETKLSKLTLRVF